MPELTEALAVLVERGHIEEERSDLEYEAGMRRAEAEDAARTLGGRPNLHGFTLTALQAVITPEEWDEIKHHPEAVEVFARTLLEWRHMNAGVVPDRFTTLARCHGCGAVMVPLDWPTEHRGTQLTDYAIDGWREAENCRWCRLRV